jgi:hypothetical protein
MFLDDVYGEQRALTERIIPRELIEKSPQYQPKLRGIRPAGGVRIHIAGVDLIRDPGGTLRVLEDNLRTPSGVSYVLENRTVTKRVFQHTMAHAGVRRVDAYPTQLAETLRSVSPNDPESATPVVLTSADGDIWGAAGGNITQDLAGVSAVAATSGPAGYVIAGRLVAAGGGCVADVWWSADMTSWTRAHDVNATDGSSQVLAVAAGAHGFVSVGSHNSQPAVWTTTNGRAWKTIVLPPPAGASAGALQQVAINGDRVVALGQATIGKGPAIGSAAGTEPGAVPFAELSTDGGATWQQVPFSSPGPYTSFTALTADAAGFTAAGLFGQPGQQDVALWASATGGSWKPYQSGGLNGSAAWQIDTMTRSGAQVAGIGTTITQQSQQTVTFTLPAR